MNEAIVELSPEQAYERLQSGALLVDVREDGERAAGMAEGAMGVSKSRLEADPGIWLPDLAAEIVFICVVGGRSLHCARLLQSRGYTRIFSIAGGTTRWKAAGLPMTEPTSDADFLERYSRHLRLSEVGLDGQRKLAAARAGWGRRRRYIWLRPGLAISR